MPRKIPVRATRNGGLDYLTVPTDRENWIAAYLRERQGYLLRQDPNGVSLVDKELARLGYEPDEKDNASGGSQN